jgi:putative acetyltransferase
LRLLHTGYAYFYPKIMTDFTISFESPSQPQVIALMAALDGYLRSLYAAESLVVMDVESLEPANVIFAVARAPGQHVQDFDNVVGCAALVFKTAAGADRNAESFAELKRMFVHPSQRGKGLGRLLLAELEKQALARHCSLIRLETGSLQPEALALYAACGFGRCSGFGDFPDDPLSVFMQKRLAIPVNPLLSMAAWQLINRLFAPADKPVAALKLAAACPADTTLRSAAHTSELERVRLAILRLANGTLHGLDAAIAAANTDWRNTLVAAGFGHSTTAHQVWLERFAQP